ncbi:hypothetical protein ACWCP6_09280 [Streptomyces sp. NPDC002004]
MSAVVPPARRARRGVARVRALIVLLALITAFTASAQNAPAETLSPPPAVVSTEPGGAEEQHEFPGAESRPATRHVMSLPVPRTTAPCAASRASSRPTVGTLPAPTGSLHSLRSVVLRC